MKGKRNEDIDQLAEHHNRRMTLTGSGDLFELSSPSINLACRRPSPSNYQPERRSGSAPLPLPFDARSGERLQARGGAAKSSSQSSREAPAKLPRASPATRRGACSPPSNFRTFELRDVCRSLNPSKNSWAPAGRFRKPDAEHDAEALHASLHAQLVARGDSAVKLRGGGSGDGDGVTLTWEDSGFSCDQQKGLLAGLQARRTPRAGLKTKQFAFIAAAKHRSIHP